MNILLTLIIIGLCIGYFGFWATVGGFFLGLLWVVVVVAIIFAAFFAVVAIFDR